MGYNGPMSSDITGFVEQVRQWQARRAELVRELEAIDKALAELRSVVGSGTAKTKPKSRHGFTNGKRAKPIQEGSSVDMARHVLASVGSPLHISSLVGIIKEQYGQDVKPPTLVSNLSRYVKFQDTFSRPAPNTFGLLEWEKVS